MGHRRNETSGDSVWVVMHGIRHVWKGVWHSGGSVGVLERCIQD